MRLAVTRHTLAKAVIAVLIGVLATLLVGPRPPSLSGATTGDRQLAERARDVLGDPEGLRGVAVAFVEDGRVRFAGLGQVGAGDTSAVDRDTRFEIGSVTKALNGMLLADLAGAGEVRLDQRVGDLVAGTPLEQTGDATLAELAGHRSGLPRLPLRPAFLAGALTANLAGGNPYSATRSDVLGWAASAKPSGGDDPAYSNFGAAVLGGALAAHQDTSYGDLLTARILEPLAMTDTTVAADAASLPEPRATGGSPSGQDRAPWLSDGFAPAGTGVWSTTADLARLAQAVLGGEAPGAPAIKPRWPFTDGDRIGLGWITSQANGRTVTWHNGGTGGFRSFVGLDIAADRAVVVLSNTTSPIDDAALELLTGQRQ